MERNLLTDCGKMAEERLELQDKCAETLGMKTRRDQGVLERKVKLGV
jgi:hypothetical protein